jgi:hypothetical protein
MSISQIRERIYLTAAMAGQETDKHPAVVIRWIQKGAPLKNGERLRLQAVRTPGQWLIKPEWLEAFLTALAADRQQTNDADTKPTPRARLSSKRRAELEQVDAIYVKEGWDRHPSRARRGGNQEGHQHE